MPVLVTCFPFLINTKVALLRLCFLPRQLLFWVFCTCATALRRQQPAARAPKASGPSLLDYKQGADAAPTVPELRHCTLYSASWLWNHTSTGTPQGRVASTTELFMTMGQKQPGSDQLFRSKRRLFLSVRHVLFQPSP